MSRIIGSIIGIAIGMYASPLPSVAAVGAAVLCVLGWYMGGKIGESV